jgi:Ice-binding-like
MKILSPALAADGTKQIRMGLVLAVAVIFLHQDATAAQAPVDLGSADSFVILAKSGISTTGTTSIGGDIGVSPIDSTAITGFGLIMDSSGQFSTSSLVTGKVYAADYAVPTPTKMTTAVSDMETAFTDAAGRTLPDATELYAGDLSGQTFAPGLYKWSTGVLINSDVTLAGPADAVWIFQIAGDLTIGSGAKVLVSGGAQAKNIFWQVGGGVGVEIGTTAHVEGIMLGAKAIHLRTGASLNGRALAQTAVTLDANPITIPNTVTASVILVSAAVVTGPYTDAAGQSVNLATKTITVPVSGDMRYYRIISGTALTITSTTVSGGNMVITYN